MVEAGPAGTSKGTLQLVLCVVSSAVAGIGIGLFGCLLSASDHLRRRNAGVHTGKSRCFQVLGIIGSIVFGLASLVGLIFGSVSLATVVRAGSTLPSNAVFSQMLGLRPLVRDDVLGRLAGPGREGRDDRWRRELSYSNDHDESRARVFGTDVLVCFARGALQSEG
eukprot:g25524.t1